MLMKFMTSAELLIVKLHVKMILASLVDQCALKGVFVLKDIFVQAVGVKVNAFLLKNVCHLWYLKKKHQFLSLFQSCPFKMFSKFDFFK